MGAQVVDTSVRPSWRRTGYRFFPFAARQSGQWWVLRLNHAFPEHDLYTLFIDGRVAVDVTGDVNSSVPLVASVGALSAHGPEPQMDAGEAERVVASVADFVDYGSEAGDPCIFCSQSPDAMARG